MDLQHRDIEILTSIYEYGGVLARRQIKEMFWSEKGWRAMEVRLSKLSRAGYIAWPNRHDYQQNPGPKSILWLGAKGILLVAHRRGSEIDPPVKVNETSLRKLEKLLRNEGISWQREPAWSTIGHDLTLVDLRRAVEKGAMAMPNIRLGEWISEHTFRSNPDRIAYQVTKRGVAKEFTRNVIPDGSFKLVDIKKQIEGKPYQARFLLEVDMATHSNPNFGRFKVAPYAAYLGSKAFIARFGARFARILVTTTGATRIRNLMHQCQEFAGQKTRVFYFAKTQEVLSSNPLIDPIWLVPGITGRQSLIGE